MQISYSDFMAAAFKVWKHAPKKSNEARDLLRAISRKNAIKNGEKIHSNKTEEWRAFLQANDSYKKEAVSESFTSVEKIQLFRGLEFLLNDYGVNDDDKNDILKRFEDYIDLISQGNKVI